MKAPETFATYKTLVTNEVTAGLAELKQKVPSASLLAWAAPFNDAGQWTNLYNDPSGQAQAWAPGFFASKLPIVFMQTNPITYAQASGTVGSLDRASTVTTASRCTRTRRPSSSQRRCRIPRSPGDPKGDRRRPGNGRDLPRARGAHSSGGGTASYPIHTRVTATVFWIGEPKGNGSSESNAISAWDDSWLAHYGGVDDPRPLRLAADGYFPRGFMPKENPFYVDLPYNDFDDNGDPRTDRLRVVPWAGRYAGQLASFENRQRPFSVLKNRWVKLMREGRVCYAQWEDSGPYLYDDAAVRLRSERSPSAQPARPERRHGRLAGRS